MINFDSTRLSHLARHYYQNSRLQVYNTSLICATIAILMDKIYLLALGLMVLGGVLIAIGLALRGKHQKVTSASNGSVAVGGANSGNITNINTVTQQHTPAGHHVVTYVGIAVEFVAIGVTIWHAIHLASK